MFVTVIHRIHDPDGFRAAETAALAAGLPRDVARPVQAASRDHRISVGLWEGDSVTAVRDVVERLVGRFADNEYYETEVEGIEPHRLT
jgi:hypothetical protein